MIMLVRWCRYRNEVLGCVGGGGLSVCREAIKYGRYVNATFVNSVKGILNRFRIYPSLTFPLVVVARVWPNPNEAPTGLDGAVGAERTVWCAPIGTASITRSSFS